MRWVAPSFLLMAAIPIAAQSPVNHVAEDPRKPEQVLELLDLAPGQRVLDFVAGSGYYTRRLSGAVGPQGIIFAHSTEGLLSVEQLQPAWSVLRREHPNVRLILGIPGEMRLPQNLDRALFHLTFHDLWWESAKYRIPKMDVDRFLTDLHSAMVPGGIVLIVDHRAKPGAEPRAETMARHRIDPAVVRARMQAAGFVTDGEFHILANPQDDHMLLVYDPAIRRKTDRFILRFRRP